MSGRLKPQDRFVLPLSLSAANIGVSSGWLIGDTDSIASLCRLLASGAHQLCQNAETLVDMMHSYLLDSSA